MSSYIDLEKIIGIHLGKIKEGVFFGQFSRLLVILAAILDFGQSLNSLRSKIKDQK